MSGGPVTSAGGGLLRRLLGESAVYGLGGVANQALAVVLVPIYANELGVEKYGIVAILTTTLSMANLIADLALSRAFFRSYLSEASTDQERVSVLNTATGLRIVVSILALLVYLAISLPLAILLLGSSAFWGLIALIGPIVFFDSLNLMPLAFLRAQRRPRSYASLTFTRAVLGSILIIWFVVVLDLGVVGVLFGSLAASIVTATAGWLTLARIGVLRPAFDTALVRHMLVFSLPLVPAAVAGWTLNVSDRYLVRAFAGNEAVGLYSAGYVVGLAINALAIAPFTLAWGAAYWEISRREDAPRMISRVLTAFVAFACLVALAVSALGTDAIRLLLTDEFEDARYVVPFSAFAYVLYGAFSVVSTGLNLESQTRRLPVILGGAAVLSVVLNVLLIPPLGYIGAAVVTLISYAVLALAAGVVSQRYYPVDWEIGRVLALLGIGLGLAAAALLGPDHVLWRLLCLAAYPAITIGLRIVPVQMLRPLTELVHR